MSTDGRSFEDKIAELRQLDQRLGEVDLQQDFSPETEALVKRFPQLALDILTNHEAQVLELLRTEGNLFRKVVAGRIGQ